MDEPTRVNPERHPAALWHPGTPPPAPEPGADATLPQRAGSSAVATDRPRRGAGAGIVLLTISGLSGALALVLALLALG